MCGICGFISKNRITSEELRAMNDTMIHRGPNDAGVQLWEYDDEAFTVGFAQRRLSIQDLSPLGHQPMDSCDGRLSIVFNGEIYNFLELKQELSYPYKSTCDTEVILAAYLKWGHEFLKHIHGMFAIALYDRQTGEVILARDRIGKKPLYYWYEDRNLVFGSELKPILKCPGFHAQIRQDVIARYLYQQYIMNPDTIFENVRKVAPGEYLIFKDGDITTGRYWSIREAYAEQSADPVRSYEEAKAGLKSRLQKAVADRMIADVPLGSFLSGGYDSSLVSALAQEHSEQPVKTFCIGFEQKDYNEAGYAREVAKHLGTEHTEFIISEKQMFDLVESIPQYYDEPFADNSEIPTMLVSALAKQKVTVALSGDGGDEFFCGYNAYENVATAQKLDTIGALAYQVGQIPCGSGKLLDKLPMRVRVVALNRDPELKTQFASQTYLDAARSFVLNKDGQQPCRFPMESEYGIRNWQVRRMLLDMETYLPEDILTKMDRASMKYSLEVRCPIMDTNVMEYSFRIPHRFKFANGDKKHILKDIAYDYIPRELLDRPKTGFGVPMDAWLRGPLREKLIDYSSTAFLQRQGIFDPQTVTAFADHYLKVGDGGPATGANYSKILWSFFIFQQWYTYYESYFR